jgi:ketosteroid isomerase-like protein
MIVAKRNAWIVGVAAAPPGKENFEGFGKMLLVLHKKADGNWRIKREMWNQGTKS